MFTDALGCSTLGAGAVHVKQSATLKIKHGEDRRGGNQE